MTARLLPLLAMLLLGVVVLAFGPRLFARLVVTMAGWVGP